MKHSHRGYDTVKRVLDALFAAILLVLLSPLLIVLAIAVAIALGRPVIFTQQRPGRDGRLFTIYKFRTMRPAPESVSALANVATDAERMTRFGRLLRSTSLDELPGLWNVLVGNMSFVGPRPLLPEYLARYNTKQARRHEVRPGITGWAQVNGRNATTWEERLDMDVHYVDNRSLALDIRILAMTVGTVLRSGNVSAPGSVTMEPFDPEHNGADDGGVS